MMKVERIALWAVTGIVAISFATIGLAKVMADEYLVKSLVSLHYDETFIRLLGLAEIAAAIGLLMTDTRRLAAYSLMLIVAGAIGSHVGGGHPFSAIVPAAIAGVLSATIVVLDQRQSRPVVAVSVDVEEERFAEAA